MSSIIQRRIQECNKYEKKKKKRSNSRRTVTVHTPPSIKKSHQSGPKNTA